MKHMHTKCQYVQPEDVKVPITDSSK